MKNKVLKAVFVTAFWLLIWQALSIAAAKPLILPSPVQTFISLLSLVKTVPFWESVLLSLIRICGGFLLGVAGGVICAVLSHKSKIFSTLTSPVIKIVRSAPVASFIVLAFVWMSLDTIPFFISFLMVLPIMWINTMQGINQIDKKLLEMATVFNINKRKQFFNIKLPSVLPHFVSAAVTSLGFAWKSGVAAEVICRPQSSVGSLLFNAKNALETEKVFALTAVIIIISAILEAFIKSVVKRWQNGKA